MRDSEKEVPQEPEVCRFCEKAEIYRDLGYPEEVYYHCYSSGCACGCVARSADAARIMRRNWFVSQKEARKKK